MTRQKTQDTETLNAYFTPDSFVIEEAGARSADTVRPWTPVFEDDKYSALLHLGFIKREWY